MPVAQDTDVNLRRATKSTDWEVIM